jgi:outer membrane receptor for ferrienterochelin and colicins
MNRNWAGYRSSLGCALSIAGIVCVAIQGSRCLGQDAKTDLSDLTLDQLTHAEVYTASRHLQSVVEAPASVTLITAKDIQEHGYRTLAAILQTVRGFYVTNDRNYSSLGVRGFLRPGDYNTRILLLVDGHRLNDNLYDQAMIGTEFPIDVGLIERIEIIRGPVSSLYGSNALFGVINIFTKRQRDLPGLQLATAAASYNTKQGRVSYGGQLGPLDFLISGSFYGSRGHNSLFYPVFDNPATNNGIASHTDDDQVASALANLSFRDWTLRGVYGTRDKGIPTGSYGTVFNNPDNRTRDTHGYLDLQYEHTFADSLNALTRVFYDRYAYHGTYMYPSLSDVGQLSPEQDFGDGRWAGIELQVTKTLLRRNRLVGGFEFRDNFLQKQNTYNLNPYTFEFEERRRSYVAAVYLQDEVAFNKYLVLNAGMRYDYYSEIQSSIDPRVALIYRPAHGTGIKLMYGDAFRIPNDYERYYAVPPDIANHALKPERIWTTEMVWEQELRAHLSLSTSVFYSRMDNLITQLVTDDQSLVYRNLEQVKSSGAEIELRGERPGWPEWLASYGFQETRDSQTNQFLNNSPRSVAKLNISEKLPKTDLVTSIDAQYRSRIDALQGNSISPFTLVNITILDRKLGKHGDLSASAYNLLDKRYSDPASGANPEQSIPQDGRNFQVQLTWNFASRLSTHQ